MSESTIVHVFIHDVEVGSLSLENYKEILTAVRRDKRLYFSQCLEYIKAGGGFIVTALRMFVHLLCLWILLACLYGAYAADGTSFIEAIQHASAQQISEGLRSIILVTLIFLFMGKFMSNRVWFSVKNTHDTAVHHRIRKLLEVPSDGPMSVRWIEERQVPKKRGITLTYLENAYNTAMGKEPRG